ncbi:MAG: hypothetical protein C0599_00690 [Salinivirgaceae bacterium]|nr:MAG: hypothetical protein C0599_00690 [Salinivirgaceae bacterium]
MKVVFLIFGLIFSSVSFAQSDSLFSCACEPDSLNYFPILEKYPQYPGGIEEMFKFIGDNIEYPREAVDKGIEDKVFVSMCVRNTGVVTDIKMDRGRYSILYDEALRVVSKMTKWEPALQNGRNVCCKVTIPVKFELGNSYEK